ncbi:hypothetical protein [Sulfitobacter sp.]|uniref:hypothetical protein n=1 Tax=Sulfitobacter sp. TaxID=1903071 RepID=UPI0030029ABF
MTRKDTPPTPSEVPIPEDPAQDPARTEIPQQNDPLAKPVSPEITEPFDTPKDSADDPFDNGNFPI